MCQSMLQNSGSYDNLQSNNYVYIKKEIPEIADNSIITQVEVGFVAVLLLLVNYLASSNRPVSSNRPGSAIKVSLPQHLMNPWEKWGNPAAIDIDWDWKEYYQTG